MFFGWNEKLRRRAGLWKGGGGRPSRPPGRHVGLTAPPAERQATAAPGAAPRAHLGRRLGAAASPGRLGRPGSGPRAKASRSAPKQFLDLGSVRTCEKLHFCFCGRVASEIGKYNEEVSLLPDNLLWTPSVQLLQSW